MYCLYLEIFYTLANKTQKCLNTELVKGMIGAIILKDLGKAGMQRNLSLKVIGKNLPCCVYIKM